LIHSTDIDLGLESLDVLGRSYTFGGVVTHSALNAWTTAADMDEL